MDVNQVAEQMRKGIDLIYDGYNIRSSVWKSDVLLSWRWWFGLLVSLICWLSWILLHDPRQTRSHLLGGLFVMLTSVSFDAIGMQLHLWHYIYPIFPFIPAYLPYDLALMPVTILLWIQWKPQIPSYWKGIAFSLFAAYGGESIFIWTGIYEPLNWISLYSCPIYWVIYMVADRLVTSPGRS